MDKAEFIEKNGFYLSTPAGSSMWPFIKGGQDQVEVRAVTGKLRKYDAILYKRPSGEHVLHRIVGKRKGVYRVRGDNCYYTENVEPSLILGRLVRIYQNGTGQKDVNLPGYRMKIRLWSYIYPLRFLCHCFDRGVKRLTGMMRKGRHE